MVGFQHPTPIISFINHVSDILFRTIKLSTVNVVESTDKTRRVIADN